MMIKKNLSSEDFHNKSYTVLKTIVDDIIKSNSNKNRIT